MNIYCYYLRSMIQMIHKKENTAESLAAVPEQEQDEDANVHESDPALITARIVQVVQNGRQNVEDVARLENEE